MIIIMEKTKSMVTENMARDRIQSERCHVDVVEEGWGQTLCFVLNVINGFTNDAQV